MGECSGCLRPPPDRGRSIAPVTGRFRGAFCSRDRRSRPRRRNFLLPARSLRLLLRASFSARPSGHGLRPPSRSTRCPTRSARSAILGTARSASLPWLRSALGFSYGPACHSPRASWPRSRNCGPRSPMALQRASSIDFLPHIIGAWPGRGSPSQQTRKPASNWRICGLERPFGRAQRRHHPS